MGLQEKDWTKGMEGYVYNEIFGMWLSNPDIKIRRFNTRKKPYVLRAPECHTRINTVTKDCNDPRGIIGIRCCTECGVEFGTYAL